MNSDILNELSKYGTPPLNNRRICSTQTINQYGDMIILTNDEHEPIIFTNLRSNNDKVQSNILPLNVSYDKFSSYNFNNIEFNEIGNCLIVWNDTTAGIIAIPRTLTQDGMIILPKDHDAGNDDLSYVCQFQLIAEEFLVKKANIQPHIAKASYHSTSPYHILILLVDGPLLVVDIIRDVSQTISLPQDKKYVTFTFGPSSCDWMRYTVYILTNTDEIMMICPLIPYGSPISSTICHDMWAWFEDQCEAGVNESYLIEVEGFMKAVFPRSSSSSSSVEISMANLSLADAHHHDDSDDHSNTSSPIPYPNTSRYMTSSSSPMITSPMMRYDEREQKDAYRLINALTRPILVQGPIIIEHHHHHHHHNDHHDDDKHNSMRKITDMSCIACKHKSAADAPVFAIAYSDGTVEICIISCADETPYSFVNPVWGDMKRSSMLSSLPRLVVGDSINIISHNTSYHAIKSTGYDTWCITADPVNAHCFHVYGHRGGVCSAYIIASKWLKNAISSNKSSSSSNECDMIPILSNTSSPSTLASYHIICDPILGHIITFRTSNPSSSSMISSSSSVPSPHNKSSYGIINLSIHMHLYELEATTNMMIKRSISSSSSSSSSSFGESESKSSGKENRMMVAQNMMYEQGIAALRIAASKIPRPENDYATDMTEAKSVRDLSAANQYVSEAIILPFEELGQKLLFRIETISDTLKLQHEYLGGSDGSSSSGLKGKLDELASSHVELQDRLHAIQQVYEDQKATTDKLFYLISKTKFKMSESEKNFKHELLAWKQQLSTINMLMEKIKRQAITSSLIQSSSSYQAHNEPSSSSSTPHHHQTSSYDVDHEHHHDATVGMFSPKTSSARGLFTAQSNSTQQDAELSGIYRSPDASTLNISQGSAPHITPSTPSSSSSLSISNLRPHMRSPYKPILLHRYKSTIATPISKPSPA